MGGALQHVLECQRTRREVLFPRLVEALDRVFDDQCRRAIADPLSKYDFDSLAHPKVAGAARTIALMLA